MENGWNKEDGKRMERSLHILVARIEQEICINFAQLYNR